MTRHATAGSRVTVARRGRGSAPVVALALAGWAMPPSVEFPRRSGETVYGWQSRPRRSTTQQWLQVQGARRGCGGSDGTSSTRNR